MDNHDDAMGGHKKSRNANFSYRENAVLVEEVAREWSVIKSKKQDYVTVAKKRKVWQRITDKVNTVGGKRRHERSLRQRWTDMRDAVLLRQKQAETGCMPSEPLPFESRILAILGNISDNTNDGDGDSNSFVPVHPKCEVDSTSLEQTAVAGNGVGTAVCSWNGATAATATDTSTQPDAQSSYLPCHNGWTQCADGSVEVGGQADTSLDQCSDSPGSYSSMRPGRSRLRKRPFPFRHEVAMSGYCEDKDKLFREWMRSEIAKNTEVAELSRTKKEHMRAVSELQRRKLEIEIKLLEQQLLEKCRQPASEPHIVYE